MPEAFEVQIPGLRLCGQAWGSAQDKPVLALHGWLDNAGTFAALAPRLHGVRLLCLDLPGHGHSDHVAPGAVYPFIDHVAAVFHAANALGLAKFGLMGHSLGAGVCALLAGVMPDRIERLVLLEGLGPLADEPDEAPARLARALQEERNKIDRTPKIHPDRATLIERLGASLARLGPEAAAPLVERGAVEVEGGATWRADPRLRLASRSRLTEAQVLAFLRRIECPTLVVKASAGIVPPKNLRWEARVEAIRDCRLVDVEGRHHVHLENPGPVAAAVAPFVAGLP